LDAVDHARSIQNFQDGWTDQFEDQTGVDDTNSIGELYDASGDFYGSSVTVDSDTLFVLESNTTDGSTTFTDLSSSPKTVTVVGDAQHDTAQQKFGTTSISFDGTGDYLSFAASSDFNFGTSDFTIDVWIYRTTNNNDETIWGNGVQEASSTCMLYFNSSRQLRLISPVSGTGSAILTTSSSGIVSGSWFHIALVRSNNNMKIYVNGIDKTSGGVDVTSLSFGSSSQVNRVGSAGSDVAYHFEGYMDEIRVSNVARWTTTFTPPTTKYSFLENMTLMSEPVVALAAPAKAHVTLFKQDVDAVTLNTHLLAWVSRSKQTVTSDFGTDEKLDATAHGLVNTDRVIVTSSAGDVPAGLSQDVVYYVVNKTTNDFEVSLTSGGSAVNITDNGSGTHSVHAVTAVTLVDEGTYSSYDIIAGAVDISAQPSDTDMVLFLQTANNKDMKIHGQSLQWED